jgi:hydrogenase/urease accessory protein HupE
VWLLVAASWRPAGSHEVRPGYLELRATATDRYQVLWKQPALGEMRLKIDPVFPADCALVGERIRQLVEGAYVDRMTLRCDGGLPGKTVAIAGLEATLTDVLVRIQLADGRAQTEILKPSRPSFAVSGSAPSGGAAAYFTLGVEHILLGVDHLLFVLGLMLLVRGRWLLFKTITAFTLGHSASLALATLGLVSVPGPPLNAAIALSIVFLAAEIVRQRRGERHLTARHPWIVAGAFGLLHGLGFAAALTALGLPPSAVPLALLFFNLGVEAGQVLFIALVLAMLASWRVLDLRWPTWTAPLPVYAMGIVAAVWFVGRLAALMTG